MTQSGYGSLSKVHKTLRDVLGVFWTSSLRKNWPYWEFFWSAFYRMWTEYGEIRSIEHFSSSAYVCSIYIFWVGCREFSFVKLQACRATALPKADFFKVVFQETEPIAQRCSMKKLFWKCLHSFLKSISSGGSATSLFRGILRGLTVQLQRKPVGSCLKIYKKYVRIYK